MPREVECRARCDRSPRRAPYPSPMPLYHLTEPGAADRFADRAGGVRRLGRRGDRRRRACWTILGDGGRAGRDLRPGPAVRLPVPPADARDPRRPAVVARLARGDAPRRRGSAAATCWSSPAPSPTTAGTCCPTPIVTILTGLGTRGWISLGAIPAAVPHTRPVPILGHRIRGRPPARRRQPGPDGDPAGAVGRAVDAGDRGLRRGHPGRRLLRPDPALRPGAVRARVGRADARDRAAPRRRAAARRPRRRGAPAAAPASTPPPRPTTRRASTSSASSRWSTSRGSPRATT